MHEVAYIQELLRASAQSPSNVQRFFKTAVGSYAEHDQFLGVKVPVLRTLAKQFHHLSPPALQALLASAFNEERLLALFIMVARYTKGSSEQKEALFNLYVAHLSAVNNWNLVDSSAHLIIGAHLYNKDRSYLMQLSNSKNLWHRRIAIVATWYFIRKQDYTTTLDLAKKLLQDQHDLIHKATGWMLREVGERNEEILLSFLDAYAAIMPRTMLRYAIEKLTVQQQTAYKTRKKT
jgi:3-methyladenine DNA glycosylase AlkD